MLVPGAALTLSACGAKAFGKGGATATPTPDAAAKTAVTVALTNYRGTAVRKIPARPATRSSPAVPASSAAFIADLYVDAHGDIAESRLSSEGSSVDTVFTSWGVPVAVDIPKPAVTYPFDPNAVVRSSS